MEAVLGYLQFEGIPTSASAPNERVHIGVPASGTAGHCRTTKRTAPFSDVGRVVREQMPVRNTDIEKPKLIDFLLIDRLAELGPFVKSRLVSTKLQVVLTILFLWCLGAFFFVSVA